MVDRSLAPKPPENCTEDSLWPAQRYASAAAAKLPRVYAKGELDRKALASVLEFVCHSDITTAHIRKACDVIDSLED